MTSLPQRSTIQTYDGQTKQNDQQLPPAQQSLDWDNPSLGRCVGDVAALGLTAPRIWVRLQLAASTGALVVLSWQAQWGNATVTPPVAARSTTGQFTLTLPTVVSDEYDASFNITNNIAVNLLAAHASLEGSTFGFANASASGNIITINTANSSGSANDLVSSILLVVGY